MRFPAGMEVVVGVSCGGTNTYQLVTFPTAAV